MGKGIHEYTKITDLKDMIGKSAKKYGDKVAFKFKTETPGKFREKSYKELIMVFWLLLEVSVDSC